MPRPAEQVSFSVRKLLANNWNAANTMSLTPKVAVIGEEKRDPDLAFVEIGLQEADRVIGGLGGGGVYDGTVTVIAHADRNVLDSSSAALGPALAKKLADQMADEVWRIIEANRQAVADLIHLDPVRERESNDDTADPIDYRWFVVVGFAWAAVPA